MSVVKNIPRLRFPEFNDSWSKTTLQNVCEVNPRSNDLPNRFVYIDLESVENGRLLFQNEITKDGSPSRAQRLLEKGDIIYQTVRPYQKNNYLFNLDGDFVASTGYAQLRSNQNSSFLYQLLHTEKFVNKVLLRSTGSNYPAINSTDLKKIIFNIPSLPEQQKIADFLTAVDKRIELLEKKKTLLETYKKGVMKKIFNQEIRFKDDNGNDFSDWEEKKLGDITNKKSSNISANSIEFNEGNYTIYGATGELKEVDFFEMNTPYISIVKDGSGVGRVKLCKPYSSVLGTLDIITNNETSDLNFIYQFLTKTSFLKFVTGSSIPHIYYKDYSKLKLSVPSIKEQEKISKFMSSIDSQIELLETQIDKSKTWKKGLLQKMFV